MLTFIAVASAIIAYGPPSNSDAAKAYQDQLVYAAREAGDYLFELRITELPEYPSDVSLRTCVGKEVRGVRLLSGVIKYYSGYECIVEVWPIGAPSFLTPGFFRHDGYQWIYHGTPYATDLPPLADFDPSPEAKGRTARKPGAVLYDGAPSRPFNEGYDPFQDFFDQSGWYEIEPRY